LLIPKPITAHNPEGMSSKFLIRNFGRQQSSQ